VPPAWMRPNVLPGVVSMTQHLAAERSGGVGRSH
jgi:hypothetical protein